MTQLPFKKLAIATLMTLSFSAMAQSPAQSKPVQADSVTSNSEIAASTGAMGSHELRPYVESYAEVVYLNYKDSSQQANVMAEAIHKFLRQPNASTHAAAQSAWVQARQSYLQTESFRFYEGPIDFVDAETGEEGPEGRINAWPMNEAFIDYVKGNPNSGIINNPSLDVSIDYILENDQVSDEADVTTGWHAIEFLLWGQDFNPNGPGQRSYEDFVAGQGNNDRRRTYLKVVTQQLLADLSFLEGEWEPDMHNYRAEFLKQDPKEAISKIFTSLATLSAFEMSSERVAVALDSGNQEDEHSCFSDTTHQDFIFNVKGIENVYFGNYGNHYGPGFDELMSRLDPETNRSIVSAVIKAKAAIGKIDAPFDQVLASSQGSASRQEVEQAITALEDQADAFVSLGSVLGVDVEILAE